MRSRLRRSNELDEKYATVRHKIVFDGFEESPQGTFLGIATTEGTDPEITEG